MEQPGTSSSETMSEPDKTETESSNEDIRREELNEIESGVDEEEVNGKLNGKLGTYTNGESDIEAEYLLDESLPTTPNTILHQ